MHPKEFKYKVEYKKNIADDLITISDRIKKEEAMEKEKNKMDWFDGNREFLWDFAESKGIPTDQFKHLRDDELVDYIQKHLDEREVGE